MNWHRQTTGRQWIVLAGPTHSNGVRIVPEIAVKRRKANPWIERVTEAYRLARLTWEADREQVAIGYPEEMATFAREFPPPRYSDFLRDMSNPDPDYVDDRYQMEVSA